MDTNEMINNVRLVFLLIFTFDLDFAISDFTMRIGLPVQLPFRLSSRAKYCKMKAVKMIPLEKLYARPRY